jgi:ATP-dependent protease ClpP protease subunit
MPKIIAISGEIGWDVYPEQIRSQIAEAKDGEALEFEISSPGGYIYDGLEIFNMIRSYPGHTTTKAVGMAASMASYLLMAGDVKKATSNAIFMIHNARAFTGGDQNQHRKLANILEGMSNMLGQEYVAQSGKDKAEIAQLMDAETYLFGNEIIEAGFVDEIIEVQDDGSKARDDFVIDAMLKVEAVIEKLKATPEDEQKIAACLPKEKEQNRADNSTQRDSALKPESKQEETMDLKQFLAENEDAKKEHDALIVAARKEGADTVQARIEAVKPFLQSEDYKEVHEECIQAIVGDEEVSTVKAMVKAIDKVKALHESDEAKNETDKQKETHSEKSEKSEDGIIRNEEDEAAAIAELKGV